jgi:hypothetical protein
MALANICRGVGYSLLLCGTTPCVSAQELKTASYYCISKFAGGIHYNAATKEWEGARFQC